MSASTQVPPVADPVAVPPVEPVAQPPGTDELAAALAKLELVKSDKQRLGQTNAELNARLVELERKLREREESTLEDQQQYKTLWEAAKTTVAALETEVATLKGDITAEKEAQQRERLKSSALSIFHSQGVIDPAQMFALLGADIRESATGSLVFLQGGVERDLAQYAAALKAPGSGYEHHFGPSGGRGMGAPPQPTSVGGGGGGGEGDVNNPWSKAGWNRTGQLFILGRSPEEAERLKAEAGVR